MNFQTLAAGRSTSMKKNGNETLRIKISKDACKKIFFINGRSFRTDELSVSDLLVKPNDFYMIINKSTEEIEVEYSGDVSHHEIVYDPYKYENSEKLNYREEDIKDKFKVPDGYIDTLPKWYSFKFTYPDYNLIFVGPELGISIQTHDLRNEYWEILEGDPIIINGNVVHYFVKSGSKFEIPKNAFHSVINPHQDKFVVLKEQWDGLFDEEDITRVHNPNHYK